VLSVGVIGLTAAGLCLCTLTGCVKKDRTPEIPAEWIQVKGDRVIVQLSKVAVLRKIGGSAKFKNPKQDDRVIVVHPGAGRYAALSGLCTHRRRPLEYEHRGRRLRCINRGHSEFGLDGKVLKGPAPRPLRVYKTLLLGQTLEVFL
jgi:Rieske Fe-S protein